MILHASFGSGHEVAAKALHHAFQQRYPDVAVSVVDALDPVKGDREWLTSAATFFSITVFSGIYDRLWHSGECKSLYERLCRTNLLQSHIVGAVRAWKPDLVVCTHSLPASILALWQAEAANPIPIFAVATDYEVSHYWPMQAITQFVVPSILSAQKLAARGMEAESILPYGIPLRPEFRPTVDAIADDAAAKDPAERDARSILVIAGGGRAASYAPLQPKILEMWHYLNQMAVIPHRWRFVVGNNSKLQAHLGDTNAHPDKLQVFGYVQNLPRLMRRAQIVVAKPGGLIIAETLAMGKPLVCPLHSIGQERANVGFLLSTGTGVLSEDPAETVEIVNALLADDQERARYQQRAAQWGKPDAAEQITRHLVGLL
jgi:processive 1,2-diacylglycerol beta-glucosyltransferase